MSNMHLAYGFDDRILGQAAYMEQLFVMFNEVNRKIECSSVGKLWKRKHIILNFLVFSDTDHELLELAASFESPRGRSATRILSSSRRVRDAFRNADKPQFVSAFCQSNCGDVSPNVLGAFCIDTGLPCDFNHSTCDGKNELCYGRGPG